MDRQWWESHIDEVNREFKGDRFSVNQLSAKFRTKRLTEPFTAYGNSGAGCISLAVMGGANKVILIGFDCQHTGGKRHWHEDHPRGMTNAEKIDLWHGKFKQLAEDYRGIEIVNCSRETALKAFRRGSLATELGAKRPIIINGMHGLGDCLHQRGVIRELMNTHDIWLSTPWPSLYHDLDIRLIAKGSSLRTQAKNAKREADRFSDLPPPANAKKLNVAYSPDMVRKHKSVYAAMAAQCGVEVGDFRMPVKAEWLERADKLIYELKADKPLMIYRPLVERKEWGGCRNRNPEKKAYKALFEEIRKNYFVISVADLEEGKEWDCGLSIEADAEFHKGELDIEILAGLFKRAGLVFTSPGFAVVLTQAVGAPGVSVFGGYERAYSFSSGAKFSPYCGIEPIQPCDCFSHDHRCKKQIDIEAAKAKLRKFIHEAQSGIGRD